MKQFVTMKEKEIILTLFLWWGILIKLIDYMKTGRGSVTGIDWLDVTEKQLASWGVKYHELKMGKPHYDLFICDKAVNTTDFFDEK